ncbi:MAG: LamG domain-containing protein [Gammaproteobacteria bacterium]
MKASILKYLRVRTLQVSLIALLGAGLAACGGGESTVQNQNTSGSGAATTYTGPAPATADVQAFKLNVWDNLNPTNRCNDCHDVGGIAPTPFVRMDDVNLAYAAVNSLVDLQTPANSALVTKMTAGSGHNCWLGSNQACADVITAYITAWAGGATSGGNVITLTPPSPLKDPGAFKNFPPSSALFASTVHPLLVANCTNCHVDSAADAQSPFFADTDADSAYEAAKAKMNLNDPADSRFVIRLRDQFHNCWDPNATGSSDCPTSATVMENAIIAFANGVQATPVTHPVTSKAMILALDGIVSSGGSRIEDNVIAKYEFKTGSGTRVFDTSGVSPDTHLDLSGGYSWVGGWGIDLTNGKAQALTGDSVKLYNMITATGEYTIEAWVAPANVSQDNTARIISYSAGTSQRNFTLGQSLYNYDVMHRSTTTDLNGEPTLSTADADEDLQATLQHVVVTYDPVNGRRIYVNGTFTDDIDPIAGGTLVDWDNSFAFVMGNEVSNDRPWAGTIRFVAIHNRALDQAAITQNFNVGVGEKFFLLFNVGTHSGNPQDYVLFEVSQFDSYSYLFNNPRYISLDSNVIPDGIALAGMRIGVNGSEATVGQAYTNINTTISSSLYTPGMGQPLSPMGTVIPLQNGASFDEFFLTFEVLGGSTHAFSEPPVVAPASPPDLPAAPVIGLRTFDEIDATMSSITDVSREQVDVEGVYQTVKQQLPTVESIEGFLSAHQMAISQMAIEYCSALVDNNGQTSRDSYFPNFFPPNGQAPAAADTAFDTAGKRDMIIIPLMNKVMNTNLTVQPDTADVTTELDSLITKLTACASGPAPTCATTQRTEQVVKSVCAATLGSAAMLIQ